MTTMASGHRLALHAAIGGVIWLALAITAQWGPPGLVPLGTIELFFLMAPLLTIPLGLRLIGISCPGQPDNLLAVIIRHALTPAAAAVVVSFWLETGGAAGALAGVWAAFTGIIALSALAPILRPGVITRLTRSEILFAAPRLYLPFGAMWLVLSRLGISPMGFGEPIVFLTALHFHHAAFASPLFAASAIQTLNRDGRASRFIDVALTCITVGLVGAPAVIAAGFGTGISVLKIAGVALLACSLSLLALIVAWRIHALRPLGARLLLLTACAAILFGMALAVYYSTGEFIGRPLISIPQMARVHGIANGLGFSLCGLLGWNLVRREPA